MDDANIDKIQISNEVSCKKDINTLVVTKMMKNL